MGGRWGKEFAALPACPGLRRQEHRWWAGNGKESQAGMVGQDDICHVSHGLPLHERQRWARLSVMLSCQSRDGGVARSTHVALLLVLGERELACRYVLSLRPVAYRPLGAAGPVAGVLPPLPRAGAWAGRVLCLCCVPTEPCSDPPPHPFSPACCCPSCRPLLQSVRHWQLALGLSRCCRRCCCCCCCCCCCWLCRRLSRRPSVHVLRSNDVPATPL